MCGGKKSAANLGSLMPRVCQERPEGVLARLSQVVRTLDAFAVFARFAAR
jgi:hypothetical protein